MTDDFATHRHHHLVVVVAGRRFALPAAQIEEVVRMAWLTRVPQSPDEVCGIVNVRGRLVAVLDPAPRLGAVARTPTPADYLVVVALRRGLLALKVDGVEGLAEGVPEANPQDSAAPAFVVGVVLEAGEPVPVLDLERLPSPVALDAAWRAAESPSEEGA